MNKQYYKEYFKLERNHWWFIVRLRILENLLLKYKSTSPLKILNVGVATGATSEMLRKFGEVTSIEYDKDCCDFINSITDLQVINGSIYDLKFTTDSFDLVCCFDVIEHVEDDRNAVKELFRVCKVDGLVFITVPAFQFLWSKHDVINHHFRRYTMKSLTNVILNAKTSLVYRTYFNSFLFFPIAVFRIVTHQFKIGNNTKNDPRSDFDEIGNSLINKLLFNIFNFERWLIRIGVKFPLGISILSLNRKLD